MSGVTAMNKGGKFSCFEAICLTTLTITSKILYTSPAAVVKQVGTAGWYMTLISCLVSIVFFLLLYLLMKRFPGKDLIDVFEAVVGKVIGKFVGFIFAAYAIYFTASTSREFLEMIKAYSLPDTFPSIILTTLLSVSILIAYKGLEVIVRISYISFFIVMIGLLIILVLPYQYYDLDYLKPYLGYGLGTTITSGIFRSSAYDEVIMLAIVIKSLHSIKDFKKAGLVSIVLSGIIFSITLLAYTITFQYTMGRENLSGVFQLSRQIYFNRYFQRIEAIFLFTWVIASVVTVSTSFFIAINIYCKSFDIKNHRPIILPFFFLVYMVALIPKNISEVIEINMLIIRQYSFLWVFGIPILVLLIAFILRKKGEKYNG